MCGADVGSIPPRLSAWRTAQSISSQQCTRNSVLWRLGLYLWEGSESLFVSFLFSYLLKTEPPSVNT